jgi:hypothetical protein
MTSPHQEMIQCPREGDVLDALASARWPERVAAELADHVASCGICRDVITVASAMQADHDVAWKEASVPSSGQMWWRAEMRARQDAVREAARPVTVAQGVAVVLALSVAVAAGWFGWPSVREFVATLSFAQMPGLGSPMFIPLAVAMGALLVAAPVALYLVISEKL